jgi:flagellar biosynthesis GTPase FlhF
LKAFAAASAARQLLVLSAGGDSVDIADATAIFAAAGADALHITRLDCARRYGGIIAAAIAGRMPITEASATPFIANGLCSLNSVSFARLLNEAAFKRPEYTIERTAS